ncbi:MAG: hypothetical protein KC561_01785, partial [Myxococcales bacterium]|nr:hypothetical protein [Myxococcales bacterium]
CSAQDQDQLVDPTFTVPSCGTNADCQGGELCRDGGCFPACGLGQTCAEPLAHCHPEQDVCVQCLGNADCGTGQQCSSGLCVASCERSSECSDGRVCDVEAARCVDPVCVEDAECGGGQLCLGSLCVDHDSVVCTPGSTLCDKNEAIVCADTGTREITEQCEAGWTCSAGEGCVPQICTPNELGCLDASLGFACDTTGTVLDEFDCGPDSLCQDGVCASLICEPSSQRCDGGNTLLTCNEIGTAETRESCGSLPDCDSSQLGCYCAQGECRQRVCEPGSGRCAGDGVQPCLNDGSGYGPLEECGDERSCQEGACLADSCTPGEGNCLGSTLITCTDDGWVPRYCAAEGLVCVPNGDSAFCNEAVCSANQAYCTDDHTLRVCDSTGASFEDVECSGRCHNGQCEDTSCTPDTLYCSGSLIARCDEDGVQNIGSDWCLGGACDGCGIPGLAVQMEWHSTGGVDLDVHVKLADTAWNSYDDINYANYRAEWFDNPDDNPFLASDTTYRNDGFELVYFPNIEAFEEGAAFSVAAARFGLGGDSATISLRIFLDGQLLFERTTDQMPVNSLDPNQWFWHVVDFSIPGPQTTLVDEFIDSIEF